MTETGRYREIGDSLIIEFSPIQKAINLTISCFATNETETRYFGLYCRYSQNEKLTYSNWSTNFSILFNSLVNLYLEVKLVREGIDISEDLLLNHLQITINQDNNTPATTLYPVVFSNENQIFGYIEVNDIEWHAYCNNIFNKVLTNILPKFIIQTDHCKWLMKAIACYLSLYYIHAKNVINYYEDKYMLLDFLRQKGLFFSGNEALTELQTICNNLFVEYKKRGTLQSINELKRVLAFQFGDEFLFQCLPFSDSGWYLDRSSIIYDDLSYIRSINKMIDKYGVTDLDNYYLTGNVGIVSSTDNEGNTIDVLNISDTTSAGIVCSLFGINDTRVIPVSTLLDYEISFKIKQNTPAGKYLFGVTCFDSTGFVINSENLIDLSDCNEFLDSTTAIDIYPQNEFVKVKCILYNSDEPISSQMLNINAGHYLRMKPTCAYIYPVIITKEACDVEIYDIRVAILKLKSVNSIIENTNVLLSLFKNNNDDLTNSEVNNIIQRYLIPVNANFNSNYI